MEVEQLNLENFDINTFEPPNFKISDSFEPIDSDEDINLELYDDEEEDKFMKEEEEDGKPSSSLQKRWRLVTASLPSDDALGTMTKWPCRFVF